MRLILLAILCAGCFVEAAPEEDLAAPPDLALTAVQVPDPGAGPLAADWVDREPNDTPETAVPIGTAHAGDLLGGDTIVTWMGFNAQGAQSGIGGGDAVDHYVFGSGPATKFRCQICWNSGTNLLDFTLYKVDGGQLLKAAASTDADKACENVVPTIFPIEPMQTYLLAVKAVTGSANYSS
jgi:hypothetical protein